MGYTLYTVLRQELARVLVDRESHRQQIEAAEVKAAEEVSEAPEIDVLDYIFD